ncbi:hypothetical protein AAFX91_30405 [Bradyrhizobium sp. 31Argb]
MARMNGERDIQVNGQPFMTELFIIKSRYLQVAQERANGMRRKPKYEGHKPIDRRAGL